MSNYIGVRCPVCNKKFAEADDIVVCPVCGAPHHRDCYMRDSRCAFAEDHINGKEWCDTSKQEPQEDSNESQTSECPRCGSSNPCESIFCQVCGNPLTLQQPSGGNSEQPSWSFPGFGAQVDSISMAYGGLDPDEKIGGESARDIARYIGGGSAYYLPRFRLISERQSYFAPNISALVFSFFYYFYRRMYLIGGILLGLSLVSMIPYFLYSWVIMPEVLHSFGLGPAAEINNAAAAHLARLTNISRTIYFLIAVAVSMCANRLYYDRVISAVNKIRTGLGEDKSPQEYGHLLDASGGCSKIAVIAVLLTLMTLMFLVSSVMMTNMQLL